MKKIDPGQSIQILANVGVIAGIVFLVFELQQNNALLAAQTRANQMTQQVGFIEFLADPQFVEIVDRSAAGEELTPGDRYALAGLANGLLTLWEWQFIEYRAGMLEPEQLPVDMMSTFYHGQVPLPVPVRESWDQRSNTFNDDFVEFMEDNIINRDE